MQELFYILYRIDDTVSKKEVNQIFEIIDANKSGGVTLKELQSFFHGGANDEFRTRIENLKWAGYIFTEINKKALKSNKSLKELLENREGAGEVEISRFRRLMLELNIATYNDDSKAKARLDVDLAVKGKQGMIDFFVLQSCLTTYINEQSEGNREDSLHLTFLGRFNFKVEKIIDYLDIEADEIITKSEFTFGVKRLLPAYTEEEIKQAFDKIVGTENVGKLPVKRLRVFYQKYLDFMNSSTGPIDLNKSTLIFRPASSDNFAEFSNKLVRFFSYDSYRFYEDLKTFEKKSESDSESESEVRGFIKFSQLSVYLADQGLHLSPEEESIFFETLHVTHSDPISLLYLTCLIFFGRPSASKMNLAPKTVTEQTFLSDLRLNINLFMKSTKQIFEEMDIRVLERIELQDFIAYSNSNGLSYTDEDLHELHLSIRGFSNESFFTLKQLSEFLFGTYKAEILSIMMHLDDLVFLKKRLPRDFFARYQSEKINFHQFAEGIVSINPLIRYFELDMIFASMDDGKGYVLVEQVMKLFEESMPLNELKMHLFDYCIKHKKKASQGLYITTLHDLMSIEEFSDLMLTLSDSTLHLPRNTRRTQDKDAVQGSRPGQSRRVQEAHFAGPEHHRR
jgi:hypothetical protein